MQKDERKKGKNYEKQENIIRFIVFRHHESSRLCSGGEFGHEDGQTSDLSGEVKGFGRGISA